MWNRPQLFVSRSQPFAHENYFKSVENNHWSAVNKPLAGGLWTSTYDDEQKTSPWVDFCKEDNWFDCGLFPWSLLYPKQDARIFVIDGYDYLQFLTDVYPLYCNSMRLLNFEMMIRSGLDGLHITQRGILQTERSKPEHLWGWDVSSTLWFKWCFEKVERIETPKKREKSEKFTRVVSWL